MNANASPGASSRQNEVKPHGTLFAKHCVCPRGLDGLPKIIPYGIQNGQFKEMSNLFKSWTDIKNIDSNAPYYAMRASSDDSGRTRCPTSWLRRQRQAHE